MIYNHTLPNVKKAITNNWNLLHINKEFEDVFQEKHILAFRRNIHLYDVLRCKNSAGKKIQRQCKK